MSAPRDDDQDKQHEPTQRKLEQAREKGEIPRSADLTTAGSYAGFVVVSAGLGGAAMIEFGKALAHLLAFAPEIAREGAVEERVAGVVLTGLGALAPWFVVPIAFAVAAVFLQQAWVFSPSKLKPSPGRISVIRNAGQKFGRAGLFEFGKSTVKLLVFAVCLGAFLVARLPEIIGAAGLEPQLGIALMFRQTLAFCGVVLAIALAIGAVDFLWQRAEHLRNNRMSRKELTDEAKETEGDPHLRQKRRQRGYEIATNRMMADVPTADVVIVNPTHYAVALKWTRTRGSAPVCVAKGTDEIAARIRSAASEAGVPIHRDPPTARALHATVRLGDEILPEHYRAVAAAIRFADKMRSQARARRT